VPHTLPTWARGHGASTIIMAQAYPKSQFVRLQRSIGARMMWKPGRAARSSAFAAHRSDRYSGNLQRQSRPRAIASLCSWTKVQVAIIHRDSLAHSDAEDPLP
jgi:hypothetical protein